MSRTDRPIPAAAFWRNTLFLYFAALALVGFWPTPIDRPIQGTLSRFLGFLHRHLVPQWVNYGFVEASANVLLFIPVGFLAALAFRNRSWWENAALGVAVSACMELGQWIFLPARFASLQDLVLNTSGTLLGIFLSTFVPGRRFAPP